MKQETTVLIDDFHIGELSVDAKVFVEARGEMRWTKDIEILGAFEERSGRWVDVYDSLPKSKQKMIEARVGTEAHRLLDNGGEYLWKSIE